MCSDKECKNAPTDPKLLPIFKSYKKYCASIKKIQFRLGGMIKKKYIPMKTKATLNGVALNEYGAPCFSEKQGGDEPELAMAPTSLLLASKGSGCHDDGGKFYCQIKENSDLHMAKTEGGHCVAKCTDCALYPREPKKNQNDIPDWGGSVCLPAATSY